MEKNKGFSLTEVALGLMFVGAILAVLFGYALPTYKKNINDAFATGAIKQLSTYVQAIDICTQIRPINSCMPGQNGIPELPQESMYGEIRAELAPPQLSLMLIASGPFSHITAPQRLNYRYTGRNGWVMSCDNNSHIDPDLCITKAIRESKYWNGKNDGTF